MKIEVKFIPGQAWFPGRGKNVYRLKDSAVQRMNV